MYYLFLNTRVWKTSLENSEINHYVYKNVLLIILNLFSFNNSASFREILHLLKNSSCFCEILHLIKNSASFYKIMSFIQYKFYQYNNSLQFIKHN